MSCVLGWRALGWASQSPGLFAGLEPGSAAWIPAVQLPAGLDTLNLVLAGVVCLGLVIVVVLIVAFVRAGKRPEEVKTPEEVVTTSGRRCPQCGHVTTRPDERFCVQCGARLPD